ncbi:MAG: spermidine/putrescine ABC transporter substrate-binding protein [Bryobacteraceae bacterium]|nr:spermidine/putrescine ABC transporter substrate-binding protein [Bryobacteraceae bacterium]
MKRRVFLSGLAGVAGCGGSRTLRLNVCNWSDYVAEETIPNFEKEFGVEVRYGTFESSAELFAKVMSGNSGWDVVFPPAEDLQGLRALNLLAPVRHELLRNLDRLEPGFRRPPWDPELRWGIPYMHGSTGIAFQKHLAIRRWADLWRDPLQGRITLLDDPVEVLGACLKKLGFSINSADPVELRAAQAEALELKKRIRAFLNAEVRDQLVAGDVQAAQAWAITAQQAIAETDRVAFAHPEEGFPLFCDNAVILRESRRQALAHRFIDYLLRPDVAAAIVVATGTATANGAARGLLPAEVRDNPVLYPPEEIRRKGEWFEPQPPASRKLRDRLWTEIKAA